MNRDVLLFDLDGTLTDSAPGITGAASRALARFGIEEKPENLTDFIGPPLLDSFMGRFRMTREQAEEAVTEYRKYYSAQGWKENEPYEGIRELLAALRSAGKRLILATSKPEIFAVRILELFELAAYFECICGAPMDDPDAGRKPAVIRAALARVGARPESAVMIGDRRHDVEGAHAVGLPAVGVLYGFGSRAELEACGAEYIAENLSELQRILLS